MSTLSYPIATKPSVQSENRPTTLVGIVLRRLRRNRLALVSLVIIVGIAILSLSADLIAPYSTTHMNVANLNATPFTFDEQMQRYHWLGTDDLGRDIFTLLLYATRVSVIIGLTVDVMIALIGVSLGVAAGYFGGTVDNVLMRITDAMYAFPSLLFAMVTVGALGHSILAVILALGVSSWVTMARMVRGQTFQVKQMEYVLSARSTGAGHIWIMWHHILPNILSPIVVLTTFVIPGVLTAEASLAFLGAGVDPSIPTLGGMIRLAQRVFLIYPHEVLAPVAALTILTLAFTFVGDGLRDALDPRMGG